MNEMGKKREPFLFIIDFEAKHTLLIAQPFQNETPYLFKINELRNYNIINTPLEKEVILKKRPILRAFLSPFFNNRYLRRRQIIQSID